jgi:membrane protein YdbS with pleckstrin-like domain
MAKKVQRKSSKQAKKKWVSPFNIYWEKKNYILLIAGFIILVIGYLVMSDGKWNSTSALVFSPIILGIAYLLIFPLSIFSGKKNQNDENKAEQN